MCENNRIEELVTLTLERGYRAIDSFPVHNDKLIEIIVSILYFKMLKDLEAINVLIGKDYIDQAFSIMRTMIDKMFVVAAITNDEKRMDDLEKHFDHMQAAKTKKAFELGLIDDEEKKRRLEELDGKNISSSKWSEWAGMEEIYKKEYTIFSDFIHVSEKSIADCLKYESGKLKYIDLTPDISKKDEVLITAVYYVLFATEIVCKYFKIIMDDYKAIERTFAEIAKPYFRKL